MITVEQYFRNPSTGEEKPHFPHQAANANDLLMRVNLLLDEAVGAGAFIRIMDVDTGCEISGVHGGAGDGGFRAPSSTTGAPHSSHREGKAVDIFDPGEKLDGWLTIFDDSEGGNSKLEEYGLYREAPEATVHWVHLTTRAPGSAKRTFSP